MRRISWSPILSKPESTGMCDPNFLLHKSQTCVISAIVTVKISEFPQITGRNEPVGNLSGALGPLSISPAARRVEAQTTHTVVPEPLTLLVPEAISGAATLPHLRSKAAGVQAGDYCKSFRMVPRDGLLYPCPKWFQWFR